MHVWKKVKYWIVSKSLPTWCPAWHTNMQQPPLTQRQTGHSSSFRYCSIEDITGLDRNQSFSAIEQQKLFPAAIVLHLLCSKLYWFFLQGREGGLRSTMRHGATLPSVVPLLSLNSWNDRQPLATEQRQDLRPLRSARQERCNYMEIELLIIKTRRGRPRW